MTEIWQWLTCNFNNRELAGATWISLVLVVSVANKDIRQSIGGVISALVTPKLLLVFLSYAGFVAALAWVGVNLGLWTSGLTTPAIVWYFIGGLPLLIRAFDAKEGSQHFRGYAKAALSGTALLDFLYVAKTFSLPVELVFTPIIAFISMLAAVSERDVKDRAVANLMTLFLAVFAVVVFWNSISQIMDKPEDFFTTATFRAFCLPIYLTVVSIPFFYLLHCFSHIEGASIKIDQKSFQSDDLKAYAKKRFFLTFFLRPWLLRRATRQFHVKPAKGNGDVDSIIREILQHERYAENPPTVDESTGWSPHAAREILADEGMRAGDYHSSFDDEWWSGVTTKELDGSLLPSLANFSFKGVEGLVLQLRLRGYFMDEFVTEEALGEFSRLSQLLVRRAEKDGDTGELLASLQEMHPFEACTDATKVEFKRERFPNEKGFELVLELTRSAKISCE
ncbi:hypothetical protein K3555_13645 [Leisingera sp. M527]|uniref:hypothetical protein n=1 Tax=Leisingera sp. M527 TaxID=2867014 RepID=UPI0021A5F68D|nr:hypothetical protein [Leisingera sp. M527]UWQ31636.1 hypothetical protein K3555_13645 [Leisingera sp. M527]